MPLSHVIKMEAVANLRDVTAYQCVNGRPLRAGLLYRSATLNQASVADIEYLKILGINTVVDLRNATEVLHEPSPAALLESFNCQPLPILVKGTAREDIMARLQSGEGDFSQLIIDANIAMVLEHKEDFSAFFRYLLEQPLPLLFHCSEGKDRTGFASALLLRLLGVDEAAVMEDYLYTNKANAAVIDQRIEKILQMSEFTINEAQLRMLLQVDTRYLQAAFDSITKHFGTLEAYAEKALGLSAADMSRLQQRFSKG